MTTNLYYFRRISTDAGCAVFRRVERTVQCEENPHSVQGIALSFRHTVFPTQRQQQYTQGSYDVFFVLRTSILLYQVRKRWRDASCVVTDETAVPRVYVYNLSLREVRWRCTTAAAAAAVVLLLRCAGHFEIRSVGWNRPARCLQDGALTAHIRTRSHRSTARSCNKIRTFDKKGYTPPKK